MVDMPYIRLVEPFCKHLGGTLGRNERFSVLSHDWVVYLANSSQPSDEGWQIERAFGTLQMQSAVTNGTSLSSRVVGSPIFPTTHTSTQPSWAWPRLVSVCVCVSSRVAGAQRVCVSGMSANDAK